MKKETNYLEYLNKKTKIKREIISGKRVIFKIS